MKPKDEILQNWIRHGNELIKKGAVSEKKIIRDLEVKVIPYVMALPDKGLHVNKKLFVKRLKKI